MEAIERATTQNTTEIALLKQVLNNLQGSVSSLTSTVDNYIKADQQSKRPNYAQWIAVASLLMGLCAGGWLILTLKINAETTPLVQRVITLEALTDAVHKDFGIFRERMVNIMSQNQNSVDDRAQLNKHLDQLSERVNNLGVDLTTETTTRHAHEIEIETQFDASSQLQNVQFAEQQRLNNVMWNQHTDKLGPYPNNPYFFPNISNRDGKKNMPVR
jgi:hypothetical protein